MARPKTSQKPKSTEQTEILHPRGKLGDLLTAIQSKNGATLEEVSRKLKWQPHTARAAITRLRQRGYPITLATVGTRRAYRAGAAS